MRKFILKLKKLEERQQNKALMLRKHQKMAQAMIDFQKFSEFQSSQSKEGEERDMQTLMSTFSGETESQQDLNFF